MVERFDLNEGGFLGERGHMEADPTGDYVRYSDYEALERQIAELRAELTEKRRDRIADSEISGSYLCRAEAAEAENARLRALPLKDEVERVLEPLSEAAEFHSDPEAGVSIAAKHLHAIATLLSRLRAGEQEGWPAGKRRFAVQSPTGAHVGLWETKAFADAVAEEEGPGYVVIELIEIAASPSVSEGGSRNG